MVTKAVKMMIILGLIGERFLPDIKKYTGTKN